MAKLVNSGGIGMHSGKQEANFATLQNFCYGLFLLFSASRSFLLLTCNAKFNSNSSFLDRLNNFGINSLQKLQN